MTFEDHLPRLASWFDDCSQEQQNQVLKLLLSKCKVKTKVYNINKTDDDCVSVSVNII